MRQGRVDLSEFFPINVGLRQGSVVSPWLFSVYMDGVVQETIARVLGRGLELLYSNGSRFELTQLLFTDDTTLVADLEDELCKLVSEVCQSI